VQGGAPELTVTQELRTEAPSRRLENSENNWSAPEATVERIQSIREETDAGTDTEVIKKSAAMLSVGRPAPEGGNAYKDDKERSVIFA